MCKINIDVIFNRMLSYLSERINFMNEFEELRKKYNIKLPGKGYLFVKRVMDIVCSAFALIVLSPILLITACHSLLQVDWYIFTKLS